jgi:hypothetical protein
MKTFIRHIAMFAIYYTFVFKLVWEMLKEWACKRCSLKQSHKWVSTPHIERGNTRVYARCRRCGATR